MAAFASADVRLAESSQEHRDEVASLVDLLVVLVVLLEVLLLMFELVLVMVLVMVLVLDLAVEGPILELLLLKLKLLEESFELGVEPVLRFRSTRYSTLPVLLPIRIAYAPSAATS